jgi:hypothetical protein
MSMPHWTRALFSLGLVYAASGAAVAACGSGDSTSGAASDSDAGHHDATSGKDSGGSRDSGAGSNDSGGTDSTVHPGDDSSAGTDSGGMASEGGADSSAVGDTGGNDSADDVDGAGDGSGGNPDATSDSSNPDATSDSSNPDATSDGPGGNPDASSDSSNLDATSDGPGAPDGSADAATCIFDGTWGSEITVNVSWTPAGLQAIILAPGSGVIKQWVLSTRVQSGNTLTDTATPCGIQLPDFRSTTFAGGELYGIAFPNSLFDNSYLSSFPITGTVTASTPGSMYTSTPSAALLGLTLANATTAAWPATITTQVDQDMDGHPGVTANAASGTGYSNLPVDFLRSARADKLYLAIRQVTQISATITDCNHVSGTVSIPQLPSGSGNYAINSHIIGCEIAGGTTSCDSTQTQFLDSNGPIFTPSTSTFASARLATGATCATVRALFP